MEGTIFLLQYLVCTTYKVGKVSEVHVPVLYSGMKITLESLRTVKFNFVCGRFKERVIQVQEWKIHLSNAFFYEFAYLTGLCIAGINL